jgi:hypothetical protein
MEMISMDIVMISWVVCAAVVGWKIGQSPRVKAMFACGRWISQKEWNEV